MKQTKKKEVRVDWHLLRHLTFFWVLIFLYRVSLLLSLSLSQPLRHSASLSKFLFILYIFCPIPRFWFPICRHQWAGQKPEQTHAHPQSCPPPLIPSVTLSHCSIWGLGHPGSPGRAFQIYKHPLGMLLRSQQPTLSVSHNTSEGNKGSTPEWPSGPSEKFQRRVQGCDSYAIYLLGLTIVLWASWWLSGKESC